MARVKDRDAGKEEGGWRRRQMQSGELSPAPDTESIINRKTNN